VPGETHRPIPTTFFGGASDNAKKFEAEFVKRAKAAGLDRTAASQFDAAAYDIVLFYAHAMKEGKVSGDPAKLADERTKVRDILRSMPPFPRSRRRSRSARTATHSSPSTSSRCRTENGT
jgi:hypothetical protein